MPAETEKAVDEITGYLNERGWKTRVWFFKRIIGYEYKPVYAGIARKHFIESVPFPKYEVDRHRAEVTAEKEYSSVEEILQLIKHIQEKIHETSWIYYLAVCFVTNNLPLITYIHEGISRDIIRLSYENEYGISIKLEAGNIDEFRQMLLKLKDGSRQLNKVTETLTSMSS